jgi:cell division protein FtsQ
VQPLRTEPRLTADGTPRRPSPRAAAGPRRDPAPSRLAYRLDRLLLTPSFRYALRVWLPVIAVVGGVGLWFAPQAHRDQVVAQYHDIRTKIENRPEFMVARVEIDGASPAVDAAVRRMLPVALPVSSFRLDLDAIRSGIEGIDAVKSAELRVQSGGVLRIAVTERVPAVIWRSDTTLELLDDAGHRVATLIAREGRPDLPLVAGEGAQGRVPEALAILGAARPVLDRVRGLVLIGERRWDIVLNRDQRILLPQDDPVGATERVVALSEAQDILGRDVIDIDLRNAARPTLRLSPAALEGIRLARAGQDGRTEVSGQ